MLVLDPLLYYLRSIVCPSTPAALLGWPSPSRRPPRLPASGFPSPPSRMPLAPGFRAPPKLVPGATTPSSLLQLHTPITVGVFAAHVVGQFEFSPPRFQHSACGIIEP